MFRNLVDHPATLLAVPLVGLVLLVLLGYLLYRLVRAGVRDGRRDAARDAARHAGGDAVRAVAGTTAQGPDRRGARV